MLFWLESPSSLMEQYLIIPTAEMDKSERLNTITRLLLVVTVIVFLLLRNSVWITILISGLAVILLIYMFNVKGRQGYIMKQTNSSVKPASVLTAPVDTTAGTVATATVFRINGPASKAGMIGAPTLIMPRITTVINTGVKHPSVFLKK